MLRNIFYWFKSLGNSNKINTRKNLVSSTISDSLPQQYQNTTKNTNNSQNFTTLAQAESKVWQGIKLEQENRLAEAIEHYRQALELNSQSAVAHHILAIVLKKQGNLTEADFYHRQALSLGTTRNNQEQNSAYTPIFELVENSLNNQVNENNSSRQNHKIFLNKSTSAIVLPKMTAIAPGTYVNNTELEVAKIYLQQAIVYYTDQHWQESINACQEALKICPDLAEVYKVYGNSLLQMGKIAEAMGYYAKALAKDPNLAEVYANMGSVYAKQCQWRQAIDYYQKALTINPKLAKVYLPVSKIWEKLGEDERALDCLLRALNLEPQIFTPQQHLQLADDLLEEGKVHFAITCYEYAVKLEPNFKDAYRKLIKALEQNGKWKKAGFYYQEIIRLQEAESESDHQYTESGKKKIHKLLTNSNNSITKYFPSKKSINVPEFDGQANNNQKKSNNQTKSHLNLVINQYLNQLNKEPNSSTIRLNLGNLFGRKQEWQQAISYYQQAIELEPDLIIAYIKLGKVYGIIGKTLKGAEIIYQGYSLQPETIAPEKHCQLGNFFIKHQQNQLAMVCYRRAIQLRPGFTEAYNKLQNLIDSEAQKQGSVKLVKPQKLNSQPVNQTTPKPSSLEFSQNNQIEPIEKSVSLSLDNSLEVNHESQKSKLYFDMGIAAEKEENWELAYQCYQNAIEHNPLSWEACHHAGEVFKKQKQWQQAVNYYQQAIKINSKNFSSHYNLGEAHLELQQWQEAVNAFRHSLSLNQNFSWSHYKLGSALMGLKQWQEAADAIDYSLKLKPDFDWAHHKLGDIFTHLENWDEAVKAYQTALKITPELPKTQEKLTDVIRRRSEADRKQAESFYSDAIKVKPDQESLYFKALEINPNNSEHYVQLARIYEAKGQKNVAVSFYRIARQINPNNSEVIAKLKSFQS